MVELSDIEMKEVEPTATASNAPVTKDEKKDADTLTLDGLSIENCNFQTLMKSHVFSQISKNKFEQ